MLHNRSLSVILPVFFCTLIALSTSTAALSSIYIPGETYERVILPAEKSMLCRVNPKTGMDETSLDGGQTWAIVGGNFSDIQGAWCEKEINLAYQHGIMKGKTYSTFAPLDPLTNGQALSIAARLHAYWANNMHVLMDVGSSPDYNHYLDYLKEQQVSFTTNLETDIFSPCTRHNFVKLIYEVIPATELQEINTVPSLPDSSDLDVLRLYKAGVLNGYDESLRFDGEHLITRGAASAIIARLIEYSYRKSF